MIGAKFEVKVTKDDISEFAGISGDQNLLHTDDLYARENGFSGSVLHGAFSAGLLSRMAGMYIPGQKCLLQGLRLKFIAPIIPPVELRVVGNLIFGDETGGKVEVKISDVNTGICYAEGGYDFGVHGTVKPQTRNFIDQPSRFDDNPFIVTGPTGGIGSAMLRLLGTKGIGVSRRDRSNLFDLNDHNRITNYLGDRKVAGIIHCGWPTPDNQKLVDLDDETDAAVIHHVSTPISDICKLAQIMKHHGANGAPLILVGSTFAQAGSHSWKMPLYSLGKSVIHTLVKILAIELAPMGMRCFGVAFDVLDGSGMNARMSESVRLANSDRSPFGILGTTDDAAEQILWMIGNSSHLFSGEVITLSGGAQP